MLTIPLIDSVLRKYRELNFEKGEILLVNKPARWSSFDVVKKLRNLFHIKRIGHAGTLDPRATGLLILCTGAKTKEIERFKEMEKEYEGVMELGARTKSFDAESEIVERRTLVGVTEESLRQLFSKFLGKQLQVPPPYSAVKHKGKPLYKYARKGKTVQIKPKEILISEFEPLAIQFPEVRFRVVCSKGTYIRRLVDDVGQTLGCGAYLKALIRTRIGEFRLNDALTIDEFIQLQHNVAVN